MKNLALTALAIVAVFFAALTWWQRQQIAELERIAARTAEEQAAAKRRLADGEQRVAAAEKGRADVEAELKELRNRPAPAPEARPEIARARAAGMNALDNPAMQQLLTSSFKGSLDQRYGGLFRQLKLSPAELEKFKDLLAERQMSGLDVMRAAQAQGMNLARDPAGLSTLLTKAQDDVDESVRTLLGNERFAQYQDYNQNIGSYALLEQIERRLSYTNAPLEAAQSDALLRAIVQSAPPPAEGPRGAAANFAQGLAGLSPITAGLQQRPLTNETVAAAQSILSKPQMEALRQLQAEQRNQAGVLQSMRAGAGIAPAPAATPPAK